MSGLANPVVTGISPSSEGPTTGGNTVTISGRGFAPGADAKVTVSFGPAAATVQSVAPTSVTVTVPASPLAPASAPNDAAGAVGVAVTVRDAAGSATSATSLATQYEYVDEQGVGALTPSVSGIGPPGGNLSGGNRVAIFGSRFSSTGVEKVTFGGVPAEGFSVVNTGEIKAVVPPELSATQCTIGDDFEPATVCQVEVEVTTASGTSVTDPILPPENGAVAFGPQGIIVPTNGFESAPASTEYDYAPTPRITSITPNPTRPTGPLPVVINGSGFSLVTFEWVNFGPATSVASEQLRILSISPDEISIRPPSVPTSDANPTALPGGVTVATASGVSNVARLSYAGVPKLDHLSRPGGPTRGGTSVELEGRGLSDVTSVSFLGELPGETSETVTTSSIHRETPTTLDVVTPPHVAGPVAVVPCTIAGCARSRRVVDTFVFYSSSGGKLSGIEPTHGGADGGTVVTLFGKGVASATTVGFGSRSSNAFVPSPTYAASDPDVVSVVSPPGLARKAVEVAADLPAGHRILATQPFRYEPSAPSAPVGVTVSSARSGRTLSWQRPESDGGSSVTGYVVVATTKGASPLSFTLAASARSLALKRLSPGHTYDLSIAAENAKFGRGVVVTASVTIPA